MLNMPSSVIALFKQDGVHKNFRVHFPNGELPDLTNDNIVQESVKFTESVCSQDVFKFGLTEASTIEFETVGVANMYGMTIECSCEIDCSSLSAADKATIAAGTWEGTWDSVNEVFAVPYGTFRVESCPRDHQAMTHRKVTAYTDNMTEPNPFETEKCAALGFVNSYDPQMQALVYEQILRKSPDKLTDLGYTAATATMTKHPSQQDFMSNTFTAKDANGNDITCAFHLTGKWDVIDWHGVGLVTKYRLFSADFNGQAYNDEADFQILADALGDAGVDAAQSGYASLADLVKANAPKSLRPFVAYGYPGNNGASIDLNSNVYFAYLNDGEVFYPYREVNKNRGYSYSTVWVVTRVAIWANNLSVGSVSKTEATITYYEPATQDDSFPLNFEPTNEERIQTSSGKKMMYTFSEAFAAEEIAQGFLELTAQFATASRTGGNKIISIDNTSPVSIIPGEYSQMWFDEYDVESIGTIRYSYTDEAGEEQIVDYVFGSGASVYDMTDNAVLKLMEGADPATIEAMLDASFIPYIGAVNFVPIDLALKGLPYIEAGDALSVTAQDGTICNSFALRHEISGIQALAAQIDSQSGLIIDSEAGA